MSMDVAKAIAYTRAALAESRFHPTARTTATALLDVAETIIPMQGVDMIEAVTSIASVLTTLQGALLATSPNGSEAIAKVMGRRIADGLLDAFIDMRGRQ